MSQDNLSRLELQVRYAETDAMRMVYYANYLIYFEVARTTALSELGHSYAAMEAGGCMIPVLEAHCHYHGPAHYGDTLRILTERWRWGRARIRFDYRIWKEDRLLTSGHTLHAFMSPSGRAIKPPPGLLTYFPNHPANP